MLCLHRVYANMNKRIILFDLDGTLTNPALGITNSIIYALDKYNIQVANRSDLYPFIGPPLLDSFSNFYGFDEEKCREAVKYYREYFADKGLFENEVYDGIEQVLETLKNTGYVLAVATSKPEPFAKQILEHFNLDKYFTVIAGSTMDETRTNKAEVIEYCLEKLGVTDRKTVLMVGDRCYDVIGAKTCGLEVMGVLFGYGDEAELRNAGADYIAPTVKSVANMIISL